jgi:hypothetical protein
VGGAFGGPISGDGGDQFRPLVGISIGDTTQTVVAAAETAK